jgi:phosphatidylethanolamine-binding protein (PEBP) family uncharacterized protein
MIAIKRAFHDKFPGNLFYSIIPPKGERKTFFVIGCDHGILQDGLKDDFMKFDLDGNVLEIGKI